MTGFIILTSRTRLRHGHRTKHPTLVRVPMQRGGQPAPAGALAALLAQPRPVLQQLLSGEQLLAQADGLFLYTPRPLELPGLRLAPAVRFSAQWQEPLQRIQLVETQLPGLAKLERALRYCFLAELEALEGCVQVRAQATLELADGLGLPQPLPSFVGQRALGLIFGRLERRCHRNLPAMVARSRPAPALNQSRYSRP